MTTPPPSLNTHFRNVQLIHLRMNQASNCQTTFTTSPFRLAGRSSQSSLQNLGEPVMNPPSIPSTTQAFTSSPPLKSTSQSHPPARPQHQSKTLQCHHHHHKTPTTQPRNHSHTIDFHQYSLHHLCRHNHRQHPHHYPHR